jgi:hypothetical protein
MTKFAALGRSGALCGGSLSPALAQFDLAPPSGMGNDRRYTVQRALLVEESLVVLAHMLLAVQAKAVLQSVEILSAASTQRRVLAHKPRSEPTYPPRFDPLPYALDDLEPEGGGYSFEVELEESIQPLNKAQLNAALEAWMDAIISGAYALSPLDPNEGYVETVDDQVAAYDRKIEWAVFKLRADSAALDGILNILTGLHLRGQRIRRVEID